MEGPARTATGRRGRAADFAQRVRWGRKGCGGEREIGEEIGEEIGHGHGLGLGLGFAMWEGMALPLVVYVLGKGGVGRSTIAAALGVACAARGERVLVMQWAIADALSGWFGRSAATHEPQAIAPGLDTMCFSAEESLREYFVDHLKLGLFYDAVVRSRHVRRFTRAAPGFEELMFLGHQMYLTTLARDERGWAYDRVVVDPPALGHGLSLFGVPRAVATFGLGGLLREECARVQAMLDDARRSAALVVTTPEELAIEETLELAPRVAAELGRAPVACVVNRAASARLGALPPRPSECAWLATLGERAAVAGCDEDAGAVREGLARVYVALARRVAREAAFPAALARSLGAPSARGVIAVDDGLLVDGDGAPATVIAQAAAALAPLVADGGAR